MAEPKKYAFKLKHGKHREAGVTYAPGQIVCSNLELDTIHNKGSIKFIRQTEDVLLAEMARQGYSENQEPTNPANSAPASDDLDKMSIEELKLHAQAEEISLKGVNLKDKSAVIAAITRHRPVQTK